MFEYLASYGEDLTIEKTAVESGIILIMVSRVCLIFAQKNSHMKGIPFRSTCNRVSIVLIVFFNSYVRK